MVSNIVNMIMTCDYCGAYTYRNGTIERIMMGCGFMQDSVYFEDSKNNDNKLGSCFSRALKRQNHVNARSCMSSSPMFASSKQNIGLEDKAL